MYCIFYFVVRNMKMLITTYLSTIRYLSVSLSLTLSRNEKVEQYIKKKTHKPNALKFWVEDDVIFFVWFWLSSHSCEKNEIHNSLSCYHYVLYLFIKWEEKWRCCILNVYIRHAYQPIIFELGLYVSR